MKDQPAQSKSKKWVDYTDSESSEQQSHEHPQKEISKPQQKLPQPLQTEHKYTYVPSKQEINVELDKLDDLNHDKVQEVWLDVFSQNIGYLEKEMQNLKKKAKRGGDIVCVYAGKEKERYEIQVYIDLAYDYIEKGYDAYDYIKITVSARNFVKRRSDRPNRLKEKESYKQQKGDNYKKKYVDKQTGKAPETIKKTAENAKNQRMYTKEEAEKKGQMIGQFRNRQSKAEENETVQSKKMEKEKQEVEVKLLVQLALQKGEKTAKQSYSKKPKQGSKNEKKGKINKVKSLNPFEDMLDM